MAARTTGPNYSLKGAPAKRGAEKPELYLVRHFQIKEAAYMKPPLAEQLLEPDGGVLASGCREAKGKQDEGPEATAEAAQQSKAIPTALLSRSDACGCNSVCTCVPVDVCSCNTVCACNEVDTGFRVLTMEGPAVGRVGKPTRSVPDLGRLETRGRPLRSSRTTGHSAGSRTSSRRSSTRTSGRRPIVSTSSRRRTTTRSTRTTVRTTTRTTTRRRSGGGCGFSSGGGGGGYYAPCF